MSAPTALDILVAARELPWTRGAFARDAEGGTVDAGSPRAVSFCSRGAMLRAWGGGAIAPLLEAEEFMRRAWTIERGLKRRSPLCLEILHDRALEPRVRAVQDRAIEMARGAGR